MEYIEKYTKLFLTICTFWILNLVREVLSDACRYTSGMTVSYVYCEHGCCGTETSRTCCSYEISTSVLVVACVVSGLVVLALIAAIIICCYKNYKDKQQSRVRALRQEQARNAPARPAEPPKPPSYIESPPEYSEQMPDSHYRPRTSQRGSLGLVSYNTRFGGMHRDAQSTSSTRNSLNSSTGNPPVYTLHSSNAQLPGSIDDAPPRYSSLGRGQTTVVTNSNTMNNRNRRFIRTPDAGIHNNTTIDEESSVSSRADTESTTTRDTRSSTVTESRMQTRAGRSASRIPQRVQQLQNGRQSSAMSVSTIGQSRMTTRSTANTGNNRNISTTLSEVNDSDINNLGAI